MENSGTNKSYYFRMKNNNPYGIKESHGINTAIMHNYKAMTAEQEVFYLEHPTASALEVWNCKLIPRFNPQDMSIEEIKEAAITRLGRIMKNSLNKTVDMMDFCDALAGTVYSSQRGLESIFSDDEILKTADDFLIKGKQLRDSFNIATQRIQSANTENDINEIVSGTEIDFETIISTEDSIEKHKRDKLREIDVYDISENVNGFFLNGRLLWLDKATRTGLVNTLNSATIMGRQQVSIWFDGMYITLNIEEARQLLAAIEIYATDCYNVTAQHKVDISNLDNIDDVDAYDVTTGYPQRLEFTMNE